MRLGKIDHALNKQSLLVFFHALLGVKAHRVRRAIPAQFQSMRGSREIIFSLLNSLS
jgi:hypothetical protein